MKFTATCGADGVDNVVRITGSYDSDTEVSRVVISDLEKKRQKLTDEITQMKLKLRRQSPPNNG